MTDLTDTLAEFAATLRELPARTEATVRADVLDTLGCALAGRSAPGIASITDVLAGWGGREEAAVWGTGLRLPAPAAALANGAAAHALDFDDTHDAAVVHAGVTVVPAALAAAQRRGGLPWEELAAAVAVGLEVACRIGLASTRGPSESGWLLTPLCGAFGAAAAAARAAGLDAETTRHALGIAYARAAGNGQATLDRALTKRAQAGFAAETGVLAAAFAEAGVTGAARVFEGPRGYFAVYHGGAYDRERALAGLGERFELDALTFKPYPCCRWTHAAIDAALTLRAEGVTAADVAEAEVLVSRQAHASAGAQPSGTADAAGVVSAQFSVPYVVAVALADGPPTLAHFTSDAVIRPDLLALAARVHARVDPDPERAGRRAISTARIEVRTRAGERRRADIIEPAQANLSAKFADCCRFAGVPQATGAAVADELLYGAAPDIDRLLSELTSEVLR